MIFSHQFYWFRFCTLSILLLFSHQSFPQNLIARNYQYIYPLPNSRDINPENNIIIRHGSIIDYSTISDDQIIVAGSKSGICKGKLILSNDLKTLVFLPANKFELGEKVVVRFFGGITTIDNQILSPLQFEFLIKTVLPNHTELKKWNEILTSEENYLIPENKMKGNSFGSSANYPEMTLNNSNNPSPGYIFLTLLYPGLDSYLMIMDNSGVPIFYKRLPWASRNLLIQPDGILTYFDHGSNKFFQLDSSYAIFDTFYSRNGFENETRFHDFIHLENGHSILMARDNRVVRMDTIVAGGDSAAIVSGFVIQELDANDNVIFQWNTFDHFQITDATEDINLLAHVINPYHSNSLSIDNDGNLLLSSRHLDEITKIDRQTGQIIWRFGGVKSANNEFVFINDLRTFSHQHTVRRLPNGNLTLLDNGNLHIPQYSRGLEYEMDEINKTATLVWNFSNNPVTFTGAAGSVQRLFDGKTLIGWGIPEGDSTGFTEVDINGNIALKFSYPENYTSYRAMKYSWRTNLFVTNPDSIFFESISVGDSSLISFSLKNNSVQSLEITDFFNKDSQFSIEHVLPFTIQPFQSESLQVKFKPASDGFFKDEMHIRSENDTSMIAQILFLSGRTDSSFSNVEDDITNLDFKLQQNYPNPFNPSTKIIFTIPGRTEYYSVPQIVTLKVYDILGNEIVTLVDEEKQPGEYEVIFDSHSGEVRNLTSGIYYYQLRVSTGLSSDRKAGSFIQTKKMILMK